MIWIVQGAGHAGLGAGLSMRCARHSLCRHWAISGLDWAWAGLGMGWNGHSLGWSWSRLSMD